MDESRIKQKETYYNRAIEAGHAPVLLSTADCKELFTIAENIIDSTCIDCNYKPDSIKPSNWQYILYQIAQNIFTPRPELLRIYDVRQNAYNGQYIIENINNIYDYVYSPLCDKYTQIKGIYPFFKMLGVDSYEILQVWERTGRKATSTNIVLRQKVKKEREESLQAAMLSSNQNPVKFLAIGNHEFNWNEANREQIDDVKPVISLDDIPALESSDSLALPDGDDTN